MAWKIEFEPSAQRDLARLGTEPARRIVRTIEKRIAEQAEPRVTATQLRGEWQGHWRWRIGDYRVIARVVDDRITIIVVRIGHRSIVYD